MDLRLRISQKIFLLSDNRQFKPHPTGSTPIFGLHGDLPVLIGNRISSPRRHPWPMRKVPSVGSSSYTIGGFHFIYFATSASYHWQIAHVTVIDQSKEFFKNLVGNAKPLLFINFLLLIGSQWSIVLMINLESRNILSFLIDRLFPDCGCGREMVTGSKHKHCLALVRLAVQDGRLLENLHANNKRPILPEFSAHLYRYLCEIFLISISINLP